MRLEADDEFEWFLRLILLGLAVTFAFMSFNNSPQTPIPNSAAFGCYRARNSPDILLDATAMHIRQSGIAPIAFRLDETRSGIMLLPEAPLRADATEDGYRFSLDASGDRSFLPFYVFENGRSYGAFHPKRLDGFHITTERFESIAYRRSSTAAC
jgi:hypothetical protein